MAPLQVRDSPTSRMMTSYPVDKADQSLRERAECTGREDRSRSRARKAGGYLYRPLEQSMRVNLSEPCASSCNTRPRQSGTVVSRWSKSGITALLVKWLPASVALAESVLNERKNRCYPVGICLVVSLHGASPNSWTLSMLFKTNGKATRMLTSLSRRAQTTKQHRWYQRSTVPSGRLMSFWRQSTVFSGVHSLRSSALRCHSR